MLVKKPDDGADQLDTLLKLARKPSISGEARFRVEQAAQRYATYLAGHHVLSDRLDALFADSEQWALIHDLRIEFRGEVAHIDHLLINRMFEGWVMTGGQFSEGLILTNKGQAYAYVAGARVPTVSPLIETRRGVALLTRLLAADSDLAERVGATTPPRFKPLTLIPDKALLEVPVQFPDRSEILRMQDLPEFLSKASPPRPTLASLARTVSPGILSQLGRHLAAMHCAHTGRYQSLKALGLDEALVSAKELFALSEAEAVFPQDLD